MNQIIQSSDTAFQDSPLHNQRPADEISNHLTVLDNVLGFAPRTVEELNLAIRKLSWKQLADLSERYFEFESSWDQLRFSGADTMHIGRAYDSLKHPLSWIPKFNDVDRQLNVEHISRLLIYIPKLSIWLPPVGRESFLDSSLSESPSDHLDMVKLLTRLVELRKFIEDGSIQIVPDQIYASVCSYPKRKTSTETLRSAVINSTKFSDAEKLAVTGCKTEAEIYQYFIQRYPPYTPTLPVNSSPHSLPLPAFPSWIDALDFEAEPLSDMFRLARAESKNAELRQLLDKFGFIPEIGEISCSDSRLLWALENSEAIKYINPLNEVNEDIAVQSIIGASTMCFNNDMLQLVRRKYGIEAERTKEMVWSNVSLQLPKLRDISADDLMKVRNNEDAFEIWRSGLSAAIRKIEIASIVKHISEQEVREIFKEETLPISLSIEQKIKSKSLKPILESGAVSFGSGAIATYAVSASPAVSIMTGAASSSLKIIYDLVQSRKAKTDASLFRMFSALDNA